MHCVHNSFRICTTYSCFRVLMQSTSENVLFIWQLNKFTFRWLWFRAHASQKSSIVYQIRIFPEHRNVQLQEKSSFTHLVGFPFLTLNLVKLSQRPQLTFFCCFLPILSKLQSSVLHMQLFLVQLSINMLPYGTESSQPSACPLWRTCPRSLSSQKSSAWLWLHVLN